MLMRDPGLTCEVSESFCGRAPASQPLTAPEFARRLEDAASCGVIGLFFDYDVFGMRFVPESGIFEFLRHFPDRVVEGGAVSFATPSQVLAACGRLEELHLGRYVSPSEWGGTLSPWLGGSMQSHAAHQLFALEAVMGAEGNEHLLEQWRCLQGAQHLLAMSMNDRAVTASRRLISHLDGPYHAYIVFMNILDDLARRAVKAHAPQCVARDAMPAERK